MRVPCGSQKQLPGLSSWKKKSSWSCHRSPTQLRLLERNGRYKHLSYSPVIPLRSFLKEMLVLSHHLGIWKRDAVNALEAIIRGITEEIARRVLENCQGFDFACVGYMRTPAEIDQWSTPIHSSACTIRNFHLDEMHLVFVILH